jgi:cytochrome c biogenesis protein CcmG/thiol:disulfide interchange protein DsbE
MTTFKSRWKAMSLVAVVLGAGNARAADTPGVRAAIQPIMERKQAPAFVLSDAAGKKAKLSDYHGKVVLLDFWATWCHGCKEEIPWFSEFRRKYGPQGFVVVGVSLDDGGWPVVKPFIERAAVPYRMLLGDAATAKKYSIDSMPDTFIIDRSGRIAAAYFGLVDRDDVEANIKVVLEKR